MPGVGQQSARKRAQPGHSGVRCALGAASQSADLSRIWVGAVQSLCSIPLPHVRCHHRVVPGRPRGQTGHSQVPGTTKLHRFVRRATAGVKQLQDKY